MKKILFSLLLVVSVCSAQFEQAIPNPRPQFAAAFDSLKAYPTYYYKLNPVAVNLNDAERIQANNDRTFDATVGNWVGSGTYSIVRSTVHSRQGGASGLVVATGAGDTTTNYVKLPASSFTPIVAGEMYTVRTFIGFATVSNTTTLRIGGATFTNGTTQPSDFSGTLTFTFLATAAEVGCPLYVFFNKLATLNIDDITITKTYDALFLVKAREWQPLSVNIQRRAIFAIGDTSQTVTNPSMGLNTRDVANGLIFTINDSANVVASSSTTPAAPNATFSGSNRFHYLAFVEDHLTPIQIAYLDGKSHTNHTTIRLGEINNANILVIGWHLQINTSGGLIFQWRDAISEIQMIRFSAGIPSNVDAIIRAVKGNEGGFPSYAGGTLSFWFKDGDFTRDWSGNRNDCILVGSTTMIQTANRP